MIVRFRHKGLERFHLTGDTRGINAQFAARLSRQLDQLDAALSPQGMSQPGWKLHPLRVIVAANGPSGCRATGGGSGGMKTRTQPMLT